MKKQYLISAVIFVLVTLVFLYWRYLPKQSMETKTTQALQASTQEYSKSVNPLDIAQVQSNSVIGGSNENDAITVSNKAVATRLLQWQQSAEQLNSPVNFYGQFIDQNGEPIPDVKIAVNIQQMYVMMPDVLGAKYFRHEQSSDSNGYFEIHGERGKGFGILVTPKDGYLLSPNTPHGFGPTAGSRQNPVIIKMWKEGNKAQLIGGSHVFGIDSGKAYTLNLITGKKIVGPSEGDLLVSITRPSDAKPRDKFFWSFSIEAVGGGLVEADPNDEFMYVAPEGGYQPKLEMQFDPRDTNWVGVVKKQLFITSRNGQIYGRAQIEIDSIYNVHSAIQISYAVNPNGSRNLQP